MELVNGTVFALDASQSLDKEGRPHLVLIAKATYCFDPDEPRSPLLAERQTGMLASDVFEGEAGMSAPVLEADYVPAKPRCDVVLRGSAHAPAGRPVQELVAGFRIQGQGFQFEKRMRVFGERRWYKRLTGGWALSSPTPFLSVPITYGRAFGGMHTPEEIGSSDPADFLVHPCNPVGRGFARGRFLKLLDDTPAHTQEAVDQPVTDPQHLYEPVSFGPVSRAWLPRRSFAGTYDERWKEEVFPLLPGDFDERYYQCAPADQQVPYLVGGEEITLNNLTQRRQSRDTGVTFRLPQLKLPMVVLPKNRSVVELKPVVDTLVIDLNVGRLDVTWRASMPLKRSLHEVHTVGVGSVCKRWWKARVFGLEDCGCGGRETKDEDRAPITEALGD